MISANVKELFKKAEEDSQLAKKFSEARSVEEVKKVAASAGIDLSEKEINEAREYLKKEIIESQLSEEDLDNVAGGNIATETVDDFVRGSKVIGETIGKGGREGLDKFNKFMTNNPVSDGIGDAVDWVSSW